ncbi:acetyl-CoA carboxylase biotin carboxyl carrier protein subunit [Variovorax sp. KK3]|uniref:acetyl-CoA carboxylase biotin carboxyl carrier protein subunit n=1 Tax=Variovorax sp. KK3 TaxID=1855728 RepID=UPI00097C4EE6|nr:acetyl-CoA carboxylase biotin carboxyl carrier protein subunit [Variovorax sp. KK3]
MKEVKSEISGKVIQVPVSLNARVDGGDTLLVVESMKMEIHLEAPQAGVVRELRVAEGDSVNEGDVVVVLD